MSRDHITGDAGTLDYYGDPLPEVDDVPSFLNGDATLKDDLAALDGASWIQLRITFVANAATNQTSELSTLGIAFAQ